MPLSLAVPRRQLSSSHPSRSDPSIDPRDSPSARVFIYACKMQGGRDVFNGRLDRSRSRGNFRRCGYIIAARPRVLAYHRHPVPRPPGRNPERGGGGSTVREAEGGLTRTCWPAWPRSRGSSACSRCPAAPGRSSAPACDSSPCSRPACVLACLRLRRTAAFSSQKCGGERAHAARNKYVDVVDSRGPEDARGRPGTPERGHRVGDRQMPAVLVSNYLFSGSPLRFYPRRLTSTYFLTLLFWFGGLEK